MKHLLKCCLCCEKTFDTKAALAEHLNNVLTNLSCPVCHNKWSSLSHLIEHLYIDDCQPDNSLNETLEESRIEIKHSHSFLQSYNEDDNADDPGIPESKDETITTPSQDVIDANKMYIEIFDSNKGVSSQELKLVSENGEQFVIMSTGGPSSNVENEVITKQNSDGTLSFELMREIKPDTSETVIAPQGNETEDNQEELYSCNTCGVSFSSVLEHIQNYHNGQEVVVEEPEDEEMTVSPYETHDRLNIDPPKRIISENGDIVEAPVVEDNTISNANPTTQNNLVKKPKNQQGKRFVQVEKFCESIVRNINQEETGAPYHKVIIKDEAVIDGKLVRQAYFCMSCKNNFHNLDDLKSQPCKAFKYPCLYCPVTYENSKSLNAHMKVHKTKTDNILPTKNFECETCNTIFSTNKSLKLHKRMHDPIKVRPIEPPVEADGVESGTGRYHCEICDKLIPVGYRAIHQESHQNSHDCNICNKKFLSLEYLEMHMGVHNMEKLTSSKINKSLPYTCLYCDRRFARPHEKVKHERIHTGEKPHSCEICGKSFRLAYCLTLHMRTHTGARPYACHICNKRFKAHSGYNHHLLLHSDVRRYKCPYCPKAFKTAVQLAGHKNSHTKPFSCTYCNRPFASLYAVRVHTETHLRQNNLKFSCSLCGASYARAFALKDHVKQVHFQETDPLAKDVVAEDVQVTQKEEFSIKEIEECEGGPDEMNELDMTTDPL